jgi:hypothetical protein
MKKLQIDPLKLTPEQRDQLDAYNAQQKQLTILQDIADMTQDMVMESDKEKKSTQKTVDDMGALLMDIRESLRSLDGKEDPEAPDYSKPIVEAVAKLEKALKAIEVKPSVTVSSPDVKVPPVDLKEFNKLLRTEIPTAFEKAIKSIPKVDLPPVDNSELLAAWEGISDQLLSIETATRMKPVLPSAIKVTNVDGSAIGGSGGLTDAELRATPVPISGSLTSTPAKDSDRFGIQAISDDGTYKYFFFEADDADYYIMRKNLTTSVFTYTAGTGGYSTVYQSAILGPSGSPTWGDRGSVF